MIVVADSSPLVVLVNVGCVEVLPALFNRIVIPNEVAAELASPRRTEGVRAFVASPRPWLEIHVPASVEQIPNLHAGEMAAIALARELHADRIIIDEEQGRKAAVERQLRVIGTVGVLEAAAERGLLDLAAAFEKVTQTDFWVSRKFLDERLALYRERLIAPEQKHDRGPELEP
jgi:predicted nucleic acid-binding protein